MNSHRSIKEIPDNRSQHTQIHCIADNSIESSYIRESQNRQKYLKDKRSYEDTQLPRADTLLTTSKTVYAKEADSCTNNKEQVC